MTQESALRFGAQTDEITSLLRIVNIVRTGEAATRPEIGRVTGLGRGVVTQRVDAAIALGFLEDGDFGPSSGGRAPRTLRFNATRGVLLVSALGALHLAVGIANLDGEIIASDKRDWDIAGGPVATIDLAIELLDGLLAAADRPAVWAVSVGLPGPVDFASGAPVAPPIMPGWSGFDVRGRFEQAFAAPTWVDNDVNLLAFAERSHRGSDPIDLVYCKIGTGIGAGLVTQGRIHRGMNGAAGDIGHVQIPGSSTRCRCGKAGCLEAEAGGWALVRDAEAAVADGRRTTLGGDPVTPEAVALAAMNGDALAVELVERSASLVGEALAALVNVFNPGTIVVGGAVSAAGETFLARVRERVYALSLPLATRDLAIVRTHGDEREPLRGGAALAVEQLFEVTFPRWFAQGRPSIEHIAAVA
jgi:predicted NBD/HSP70 family sugar kinase